MGFGKQEENLTRCPPLPLPAREATRLPARRALPARLSCHSRGQSSVSSVSHLSLPAPESRSPAPPPVPGRAHRRRVAVPGTWEGYPLPSPTCFGDSMGHLGPRSGRGWRWGVARARRGVSSG